MWLSGLDTTHYHIGKKIELGISIVPIGFILFAIYKMNNEVELTILKRIVFGLTVGLVSIGISAPFIEIYHQFINPEWFDAVLRINEQQMEASGATQSEISARLEQLQANNTPLNALVSALLSGGIIFPAIVSLASLLFIRSTKNAEQEQN
jgi:hypothetical protein